MKKLFAILLVVIMVLTFAACKKPATTNPNGDSTASVKPTTDVEIARAEAEIRRAVSLLLDRNYIVEHVSQAGEKPANSFVADGMADDNGGNFANNAGEGNGKGYFSVTASDYETNVKSAIETLKKYYDFKDGKFVGFPKLTYIYNTNDGHKKIAEYIQSTLAKYGIEMTLENQEWSTFLDTRKEGNYSVARNGWVADYTDPVCFLDMWVTASGNNDVQFGKGEHKDLAIYNLDLTSLGYEIKVENGTWAQTYDVLISEIKKCTDMSKRYTLMHIAEDMLMETGCITPIYYYTDLYMIDDSVKGFYSSALGYKYFQGTTVNGQGTSLSVCLASEPDSLDPAKNSAVDGATMLVHLFAGLAKWAPDANDNMVVVPDCATELPAGVKNADGTVTYTYTLKDGLKWSDGQALTAEDFEFAWKRAASAELGADYGYLYEIVKGYGTDNKEDLAVEALDAKTLQVTLANEVTFWNEMLAFPTFFPVRADVVDDDQWCKEAGSTYVCNGPYTMTAWEHNSVITLTKNANYHDAENVKMNELKFFLADDANNMLTNFKNGAWLMIDDVPTNEIAGLKSNPEFVIAGQIGTYYVSWNINESLLPKN